MKVNFFILSAVLLALNSTVLRAQDSASRYPSRPVAIIVPNAPGASFDVFARMYADKLAAVLGQPFLVDYKPGASGTIASTFVSRSAPDGQVLLIVSPSFTIAPMQYKELPFDPIKSFAPISLMTRAPYVFVVNSALPAKNLTEYIVYAKANPGKLNIATTGAGAFNHLAAEWIHSATKTQASFVHYKGGTAYLPDLASGRVNGVIASITFMRAFINAGKVTPLALTSVARNSAMPDTPTVAEQIIPGYNAVNWVGLMAVAGTPAGIVSRLNAEITKILKQPDVLSALNKDGTESVGSTPDQFSHLIAEELGRWRDLIQSRNIKMAQ